MRLLRSWPAKIPEGRTGYVVDGLPRQVVDLYDIRSIGEIGDAVLLLEWDIAVGKDQLRLFIEHVQEAPKRVLVAPYRIYPEMTPGLAKPVWVHRRFVVGAAMPGTYVQIRGDNCLPVEDDEPFCHLFGFGMTYLPEHLIRGFLDDHIARNPNSAFADHLFSEWHFHHAEDPEVPITWDIRPVHLHYSTKGLI